MDGFLPGLITGAVIVAFLNLLAESLRVLLPWKRGFMSGAKVDLVSVITMHMRGCPPALIIDTYCALLHSGHKITIPQVESCYIANKHKIRDDDVEAFIEMVKQFVKDHPADVTVNST